MIAVVNPGRIRGGGPRGHPPSPVKKSHKKMATEGSRIDFVFLAPSPYPTAGSPTESTLHLIFVIDLTN